MNWEYWKTPAAIAQLQFVSDPGLELCGPFKRSVTATKAAKQRSLAARVMSAVDLQRLYDGTLVGLGFIKRILFVGLRQHFELPLSVLTALVGETFLVTADLYVFVPLARQYRICQQV